MYPWNMQTPKRKHFIQKRSSKLKENSMSKEMLKGKKLFKVPLLQMKSAQSSCLNNLMMKKRNTSARSVEKSLLMDKLSVAT